MKMRKYMKKKQENIELDSQIEETIVSKVSYVIPSKKALFGIIGLLISIPIVVVSLVNVNLGKVTLSEEGSITLAAPMQPVTTAKKGSISIPSGTVNANPFLPYRDIGKTSVQKDVPAFDLVEPPEVVNENSDAARVMDTIVSGILYDKYSPSAILNIEGNDYLVKKGDIYAARN